MNGNPREGMLRARGAGRKERGLMRLAGGTRTANVDAERGVFMISVAAELAEIAPQTLRMYEARGLIQPSARPRAPPVLAADVERLRRIQQMTVESA
jgi:MerR family transcriptional regulator/heat shock protein HspR